MPKDPDELAALREALGLSPHNLPLRRHLAQALSAAGRADEAEAVLKDGLKRQPDSQPLKLLLAECYRRQGKRSAAFVILEDLIKRSDEPGPAYLAHARILLETGEAGRAAREYRKALDADPELRDAELEDALADDDEDPVVAGGRIREPLGGEGGSPAGARFRLERPALTFADVGGMDALKEAIRLKIIHPLTHPEIYAAYGKPIGGGILMYGPPGCGKTHLARATAGEVQAGFIPVGINDVLDMWMGNSEKNLHALFELARQRSPCVLFFDEVDALGASRSDMRQRAGRQLINQFLAELDGVSSNNDGVLILAATNAPWHLDSAFRRPGRFDRILFVPPPDTEARAKVLEIHTRDKPTEGLNLGKLAKKAAGLSGADLKAVVDQAVEAKLQEALRAGVPQPLRQKDLAAALKQVRPSTRAWFETARNYALYSNEGGLYDDVLAYLKL